MAADIVARRALLVAAGVARATVRGARAAPLAQPRGRTVYADVAEDGSRFYDATCPWDAGHLVIDGRHLPAWDEGVGPGGLRLAASDRWRMAVAGGASGTLLIANHAGAFRRLGAIFGTQSVGIARVDRDHFRIGACIGPSTWKEWIVRGDLIDVTELSEKTIPDGVGGGQGWLDYPSRWTDADRGWIGPKGERLTLWMQRGPWLVGQSHRPETGAGGVDVYDLDGGRLLEVARVAAALPSRIAALPDGRARVAISHVDAHFIDSTQFQPVPVIVPDDDGDDDQQDETDEDTMQLPNHEAVVRAVDQQFPHLLAAARQLYQAGKAAKDQALVDEGERLRGDFVDQVAHELNRRDGTNRWGRKARRAGDAGSLNDDALTYRLDDRDLAKKVLVDVISGDHFAPAWQERPASEMYNPDGSPNGYWHPPVKADLAGTDTPPPPPPPPPPPQSDKVLAEVRALREEMLGLFSGLERRLSFEHRAMEDSLALLSKKVDAIAAQLESTDRNVVELVDAVDEATKQEYRLELPGYLGGSRPIRKHVPKDLQEQERQS